MDTNSSKVFKRVIRHELSHIVGNMLTYAQLIKMNGQKEDFSKFVDSVIVGCHSAMSFVDQVICNTEEANFPQKVNIINLIEEALSLLRNKYISKKVEKSYIFSKPPVIYGSPVLLKQVFVNLLDNASRAMGENGVLKILVETKDDEIKISFKDTGCGMSNETKKRIFDPFYSESGSSGLGLWLCRGIIRGMGGNIYVESELGKGSTFTITLPLSNRQEFVPQKNNIPLGVVVDQEEILGL